MDQQVTVIADELTATLFRLAGVRVHVPDAAEVEAVFGNARSSAALVLITAGLAARLPSALLDQAVKATRPLTLVVPDALARERPTDVVSHTQRILGVEA